MTRKSIIRERLSNLGEDEVMVLTTASDVTQVRMISAELGRPVTIKSFRRKPNLPPSEWVVEWKKPTPIVVYSTAREQSDGTVRKVDSTILVAPKHWESRQTPVGKSGRVLDALAYYEPGHDAIPAEWLVWDKKLGIVFKPKYVRNPATLTNRLNIELGLSPTRFMLATDYTYLDEDEALERFKVLESVQI